MSRAHFRRNVTTSSGHLYAGYLNGNFGTLRYLMYLSSRTDILARLSSTKATLVALFCTFSEVFDVPVYWPILVVYFFVLFALTMRKQIQ